MDSGDGAAGFGENDGERRGGDKIFSSQRANVALQSGENMVKYS